MPTLIFVLLVATGLAGWKITTETTAEYVAKYLVEDDEFGVSKRGPRLLQVAAAGPAVEGATAPILLAADAPSAAATPAAAQVAPPLAADPVAEPAQVDAPVVAETPAEIDPEITRLLALVSDAPERRPDGSVFLPVISQRIYGLRTVLGERASVPVTVELPGRVIPSPNTAAFVQVAQEGFIEPADGRLPFAGQVVRRGQLLAHLRPTLNNQARLEVEGKIQELESSIDFARRRMARLEEVFFVRYREGKIEAMHVEIVGMQRQIDGLRRRLLDRVEIRAGTDGIVSGVEVAAGQHVEPGRTLFEIVDPSHLWVRAAGFAPDLAERIEGAEAITTDGKRLVLRFVGGGLTLRNQAIPLQFEIITPPAGLAVENPVTVVVRLRSRSVSGVRIPRASVSRTGDGRLLVWERRTAETFVPHHVTMTAIDARNVLVTSDLPANARFVTAGVAALGQVR